MRPFRKFEHKNTYSYIRPLCVVRTTWKNFYPVSSKGLCYKCYSEYEIQIPSATPSVYHMQIMINSESHKRILLTSSVYIKTTMSIYLRSKCHIVYGSPNKLGKGKWT